MNHTRQVLRRICAGASQGALAAAAAWGLVGCVSFDTSGIAVSPTEVPDAASAADATPPDAPCWSWTPAHFHACTLPPTENALVLTDGVHVYDTDIGMFTTAGAPPAPPSMEVTQADTSKALLISVTDLRVEGMASLRVVGFRPIIIAASGSIEIAGRVSVSSNLMDGRGAGANPSACQAAMPGENDAGGGGGGGGGGFQGRGGNGGPGDSNDSAGGDGPSNGGAGGSTVNTPPVTVRGGCPGAAGGMGSAGMPGRGGAGGGAIQLTAQMGILVTGIIEAGGSGGQGGPAGHNGGGGGGSGGYIGLDAPIVTVQGGGVGGVLAANGGGGGEGGVVAAGGLNGFSGLASDIPAAGGEFQAEGGNGARGGASIQLDGADATNFVEGGGGGGGGGVGFIIVRTADFQTVNTPIISPLAVEITP